jgi:hypothetical protein
MLLSNLDSCVYPAKKENHTDMLKMSIRLMSTIKRRKPEGRILIKPPTALATTVSRIPAANEINHAGK